MVEFTHVAGRDAGRVQLYALSTCAWCRKTRKLLEDLKVDYYYVYVDLLSGKEEDDVMGEVMKYNPDGSFPTIVIGGRKVIRGFREEEIKGALKG